MFSDHMVNKKGHRLELSKVSSHIEGCAAKKINAKSAGFSGFFVFFACNVIDNIHLRQQILFLSKK